jgi:hypothetical protein
MSFSGKGWILAAAALGSILAGASPALAQNHGGGGHAGGGGAHFSGGGHMGGGHMGGGHAPAGAHFGGGAHFSGPAHVGGYGGVSRGYAAGGYRGGYAGHPGYGYPGHYWHGYSTGRYWGGGYWNGGFWPRAYYGLGWAWFLPVLPLAYSTYWWGGVPYYYANDVYYTWSGDYQGYVATDPPPVTGDTDSGSSTAPADAAPQNNPQPPAQGSPAQIFMYPKNGQSTDQQAQDRSECEQWAQQQAGQNGPDYNRAMVACVEGRGYSAR